MPIVDAIENNKLVAASVLSGNRNFEGRVHANVRANYLASRRWWSPMRWPARITLDITKEPLGNGSDGKPVYLKDIWPTQKEVNDTVHACVTREMFLDRYGDVFKGPEQWQAIKVDADSDTYRWNSGSTYVQNPPYFEGMTAEAEAGRLDPWRPRPGRAGRQHHHRPHLARPATSASPARPANTCWSTRSARTTSTATAPAAATTRS